MHDASVSERGANTLFYSHDNFRGYILKNMHAGTSAKKILTAISTMLVALALAGCLASKATPITSVPGVTNSNVFLHVPDDGSAVILSGKVNTNYERVLVEKHVRNTLGYERISNRIRFD